MNFLIIGAGGIGCYYGALLQKAGHQVTLVARGEHLQAMQQNGLKITHPDFNFNAPVNAHSVDSMMQNISVDDIDLIILTIKGTQTESLLNQISPWLNSGSRQVPMLSLQNGIDNEAMIEQTLGKQRTLGGLAVKIGGHVIAPGVIEATGPAQVVMGLWPNNTVNTKKTGHIEEYAEAFRAAGIPTTLSDNIQQELWKKLLINNGVNPLSALTELDTRTLTAHPVYGDIVYRLMLETAAVAKAAGVTIPVEDVDAMYQLICNFDAIKTSMLVDKLKGRPLEIDAICGAILRRAEKYQIATPFTAFVNALVLQQVMN
jgi:2-dehydropantoate 2-reductase